MHGSVSVLARSISRNCAPSSDTSRFDEAVHKQSHVSSVGRMEPMMGEILAIVRELSKGHGIGAQSIISASGHGDDSEWKPLKLELLSEGIPIEYIQEHQNEISIMIHEVIEDEGLSGIDIILPEDLALQV